MNTKTAIVTIIIAGVLIGVVVLTRDKNPDRQIPQKANVSTVTGNAVSEKGIHWHPDLSIVIKGKEQSIPANIGIGMQYAGYPQYDSMMMMTDMHTHDASGQLHWEIMEGPVKNEDIILGHFFSVWAKRFDSSCIFEFCNDSEGIVTMSVNGQPNTEFQDYLIKDGDKIEIRYE